MRAFTILIGGFALFAPIFGKKTIFDIFNVKGGKTQGGCDDIHLRGQDIYYCFLEAAEQIKFATSLFEKDYVNSRRVRNVGLTFFGIEMNGGMTDVKDDVNQEKLNEVIERLKALREFVEGVSYIGDEYKWNGRNLWFFCDSDWVTLVKANDPFLSVDRTATNEADRVYRNVLRVDQQTGQKYVSRYIPGDTAPFATLLNAYELHGDDPEDAVRLATGELVGLWSENLGHYRLGESSKPETHINFCDQKLDYGLSTIELGEDVAVTICLRPGNRVDTPKFINAWNTQEGVYLDHMEMMSLTFVHEFFHVDRMGKDSVDLLAWTPPDDIPLRNPDGSENLNWPGDPRNFKLATKLNRKTNLQGTFNADSVSEILLLTLADGRLDAKQRPINIRNNPQTYAWAILATYLAHEGGMMDYSSGISRAIGPEPGRLVTPAAKYFAKRQLGNSTFGV